jgi:hypothetical protein
MILSVDDGDEARIESTPVVKNATKKHEEHSVTKEGEAGEC